MSIPIVIIFERHWDTIPKEVIKESLQELSANGYTTFCMEAPYDLTSERIQELMNKQLQVHTEYYQQTENFLRNVGITRNLCEFGFIELMELTRQYVSSRGYAEVTEKVKNLPAVQKIKEILEEAANLPMSIKGVDIESEEHRVITSENFLNRSQALKDREEKRLTTIFQNLVQLRKGGKEGVIFLGGALHADGLLKKFKEQGTLNEVLYYCPRSVQEFDQGTDDFRHIGCSTLVGHTQILALKDVKSFKDKIITDIADKTKNESSFLYHLIESFAKRAGLG